MQSSNISKEQQLYKAAEAGRLEDVQHLLGLDSAASGGYIDIDWMNPDSYGRTPLCIASFEGHLSVATLLLKHGADANKANSIGYTPLYWSLGRGHVSVASLLLKHGADVNRAEDRGGQTPLYLASVRGFVSAVLVFLQHGADVNKADKDEDTPLYVASYNCYDQIVTLLLQHGADVNKANNGGQTPLHAASEKGRMSLVSLLLQHGADVNKADEDGETPMSLAARYKRYDVVRLLLPHYIDMYEQQYYSGGTDLILSYTSPLSSTTSSTLCGDDAQVPEQQKPLLDDLRNEVVTRSRILCLLHVLFETWVVNLMDDDVTSMLVEMLILEGM